MDGLASLCRMLFAVTFYLFLFLCMVFDDVGLLPSLISHQSVTQIVFNISASKFEGDRVLRRTEVPNCK